MPRYLVECPYANGISRVLGDGGAAVRDRWLVNCQAVGVAWLYSYVDDERRRSFSIYDGPDPEAVRRAAEVNELPVTRITRVSVLDPYAFR